MLSTCKAISECRVTLLTLNPNVALANVVLAQNMYTATPSVFATFVMCSLCYTCFLHRLATRLIHLGWYSQLAWGCNKQHMHSTESISGCQPVCLGSLSHTHLAIGQCTRAQSNTPDHWVMTDLQCVLRSCFCPLPLCSVCQDTPLSVGGVRQHQWL